MLDADPALARIPLIVGTSAGSTRETIDFTKDAAKLGADFAMVITPGACFLLRAHLRFVLSNSCSAGYFAGLMSRDAIKQFYLDVAEASPIPVRLPPAAPACAHICRRLTNLLRALQILVYNCASGSSEFGGPC